MLGTAGGNAQAITLGIKIALVDCARLTITLPGILDTTPNSYYTITWAANQYTFSSPFTKDCAACPINSYNVVKISGGAYADYTTTDGSTEIIIASYNPLIVTLPNP